MTLDTERPTGKSSSTDVVPDQRTRTIADLVRDLETAGWLQNRAQILVQDSSDLHETVGQLHADHLDELFRTVTTRMAQVPFAETLTELSERGFSWKAIADLAGVSIPALRKWRKGESQPSGENRLRIARLASFCSLVNEHFLIQDVAGWLETQIHPDAPITGLDLLREDHFDQAFRLARQNGVDPEQVLDEIRPEWRDEFRSEVETFVAADGLPGLRINEEGL